MALPRATPAHHPDALAPKAFHAGKETSEAGEIAWDLLPPRQPASAHTARSTLPEFFRRTARWQPCNYRRSTTLPQFFRRTCDSDKSAADQAYPMAADQIPEPLKMDRDRPYSFAHKKDRPPWNGLLAGPKIFPCARPRFSTERRGTSACAPARGPIQPSRSRTKCGRARLCRSPRQGRSLHGPPAAGGLPHQMQISALRDQKKMRHSDRHRMRLLAWCSSRPESTAILSPRDHAAECTRAASLLRSPAAPSMPPPPLFAQLTSDSRSTGFAAWPSRRPLPLAPPHNPAAIRSSHMSSITIPKLPFALCTRAALPPKNSSPCNSNTHSTRRKAPRFRARAPGAQPRSYPQGSSPRPTDSKANSG